MPRRSVVLAFLTLVTACRGGRAGEWDGKMNREPNSVVAQARAHGRPVQVCVGSNKTCARMDDGSVACWGDVVPSGGSGFTGTDRPFAVPGLGNVTQIDCAYDVLARLADGSVTSFSRVPEAPKPVPGVTSAVEVHGGNGFACTRQQDGLVACWGNNGGGQLGQGTTDSIQGIVHVKGVAHATALAVAGDYVCAREAPADAGEFPRGRVLCWGMLGNAGVTLSSACKEATCPTPVLSELLSASDAFAIGHLSTCTIRAGKMDCSGGQGHGPESSLTDVVEASAGYSHFCARTSTGHVECNPPLHGALDDATQIARGAFHQCALRRSGELVCWGGHWNGELGRGDEFRTTPVAVAGISGATRIATSSSRTCAVLGSGRVTCWPRWGALEAAAEVSDLALSGGRACVVTRSGAVQCLDDGSLAAVALPRPARTAVVGLAFACALLVDGTVSCWGKNDAGQLGDGTTANRVTAAPVLGLSGARVLAAGAADVCAADADQRVFCWGAGTHSTEGPPEPVPVPRPTPMKALDGTVALAFGDYTHLRAVSASGDARGARLTAVADGPGWTMAFEHEPPLGMRDAVEVAVGSAFDCGRTAAGEVRCWGDNERGELGDGTTTGHFDARRVVGVSAAKQIVAADNHACALVEEGRVLCWGSNQFGAVAGLADADAPAPVVF